MQELGGTSKRRGNRPAVNPTYITPALVDKAKENNGIGQRSGYYFLCYLPGVNGSYIRETSPLSKAIQNKSKEQQLAIDNQEKNYIVYAWPIKHGSTGYKAFFVDQGGEVLMTANEDKKYSGLENIPNPTAALQESGVYKAREKASDGQIWNSASF